MVYHNADEGRRPGCAPSVLITFINMMLFKDATVLAGCSQYMFQGQDVLQKVLIFSALACVPVMLFGKPIFILCTKKFKSPGKVYVSNLSRLLLFVNQYYYINDNLCLIENTLFFIFTRNVGGIIYFVIIV